jgi:hypothetical protein
MRLSASTTILPACLIACLSALSACAPAPNVGAEGQPCTTKGACLEGLVCNTEKICVKPGQTDGGLDGSFDAATDSGMDAANDGSSDFATTVPGTFGAGIA